MENENTESLNENTETNYKPRNNTLYNLKDKIKELLIFASSRPIDEERRDALKERIENDVFLQDYFDKRITPTIMKYTTPDIMASTVYAYHYYQVKTS